MPLCGRSAGDGGGCAVRGEDCLFGGGMEKGIPADGGDISEKDRAGVVYLRRAGVYVKSPDLLAAAQAVFRREKPAHVHKQRRGR